MGTGWVVIEIVGPVEQVSSLHLASKTELEGVCFHRMFAEHSRQVNQSVHISPNFAETEERTG